MEMAKIFLGALLNRMSFAFRMHAVVVYIAVLIAFCYTKNPQFAWIGTGIYEGRNK